MNAVGVALPPQTHGFKSCEKCVFDPVGLHQTCRQSKMLSFAIGANRTSSLPLHQQGRRVGGGLDRKSESSIILRRAYTRLAEPTKISPPIGPSLVPKAPPWPISAWFMRHAGDKFAPEHYDQRAHQMVSAVLYQPHSVRQRRGAHVVHHHPWTARANKGQGEIARVNASATQAQADQ